MSFVVAIDGPAASGKSTTARLVAERLGFLYLDTGAMYRAVTWKAQAAGVSADDPEGLAALVRATRLALEPGPDGVRIRVDGEDVTERIRAPEISRGVSAVASVPAVRRRMVEIQREVAHGARCVVEGRDIGTVVFPEAPVKIFLEASLEERAVRRQEELLRSGIRQALDELREDIARRDRADSEREDSPLRRADDAVGLDTTGLTIEEQVEEVLCVVRDALEAADAASEG